ncbi:MAG: regulatory protein RecX [Bdellovibrionales bacterium]
MKAKAKAKKQPKPVRLPTASYLENAALYYVQRFAATTTTLTRALQRKVLRAQHAYPDFDAAPFAKIIADLVQKFVRLGYVNDKSYADAKVSSLRRKGGSARAINAKLREKGIANAVVANDDDELAAARLYVKRKRLGPYRTRTIENAAQKDLAALTRAGFSGSIARLALRGTLKE